MKIYRDLAETPADFGPCALTIGNFDGVHAAHRRILRRVCAVAAERGLSPSVLTFHPHPTVIVAPERAPRLMTTPEQRALLMAGEGIEQVLILPFTAAFSQLTPEQFVERVLAGRLRARAVLVGSNFRFGAGQEGDVEALARFGERYGFATEVVPALRRRGRMVSSSALRLLTAQGKVSIAARLLERPYALEGDVVSGRGVGARQTVPTLNLATESQVIPASGVYVTRTFDLDGARSWRSVTNIGYRPTFGESDRLSIETFLLDALEGAAPARIRVEFLYRLREERKFASPELLKAQILRDVARAQAYFRRSGC